MLRDLNKILPEFEPKANLWSKIEETLNFDDLLEAKIQDLPEFEPSLEWNSILEEISVEQKPKIVKFPSFIRWGIAASITLILGFVWLSYKKSDEGIISYSVEKQVESKTEIQANTAQAENEADEINHSWQRVKAILIGPNELGFPDYDLMFVNPRLGYSYKPLPWLRLNAGLGTNLFYESKFQFNRRLKTEQNRAEYFATSLKQYENDNSANGQQQKAMLLGQQKVEAISSSYFKSIRKVYFDARLGVGVDFGGFMIDLNYNRSFTPIIQDIDYNGQTSPLNLQYDYLSLSVGYRLLPIRKFLLPPRKNKTYEKIQSEIPFYKNEVNFLFGKQSENRNSLNIYESSYTRYLLKLVGVTISTPFNHHLVQPIMTAYPTLVSKMALRCFQKRSFCHFTQKNIELVFLLV